MTAKIIPFPAERIVRMPKKKKRKQEPEAVLPPPDALSEQEKAVALPYLPPELRVDLSRFIKESKETANWAACACPFCKGTGVVEEHASPFDTTEQYCGCPYGDYLKKATETR